MRIWHVKGLPVFICGIVASTFKRLIYFRPTPIKKLPDSGSKGNNSIPGVNMDIGDLIPRPSSVGSSFQPKGK